MPLTRPAFANPTQRPTANSPRRSAYYLVFISVLIASLALLFGCVYQKPFNLSLTGASQLLRRRPGLQATRIRQSFATASPSTMVYSTKPVASEKTEKPLSAQELREWNHMAEGMEYYHTHFRHSFDTIYEVSLFRSSEYRDVADLIVSY